MQYFFKVTIVLSIIIILFGAFNLTRRSPSGQMKVTENIFKAFVEVKSKIPVQISKETTKQSQYGKDYASFGAPAGQPFNDAQSADFPLNQASAGPEADFDIESLGKTPDSGGDFAMSGALTEEDYGSPKNYAKKEKPLNPDLEAPLIAAVASNNITEVRRLLAEGASPNTINNATSATPLFTAIAANDPEMVGLLLDFGASQNQVNDKGFMPIHEAASGGAYGDSKNFKSDEIILLLLENGVDINQKNAKGQTPLMLAAKAKKADTVRFLINNGAKPDIKNAEGKTALGIAQQAGCKECADILLAEDMMAKGGK